MDAFKLTKWYMDVTDAAGQVAIGYWASLGWGRLALTWQSIDLFPARGPAVHRSSLSQCEAPRRTNHAMNWQSPALQVTAQYHEVGDPFLHRLFESKKGTIDWCCKARAADVQFDVDGESVRGSGYAECLTLTVPPWAVKFDELRWGRWISSDLTHSMVWIDWRGADPLTLVFVNGVDASDAFVRDDQVGAGGQTLELQRDRKLVHRPLSQILEKMPRLREKLSRSWGLTETKWLSRGVLDRSDGEGRQPSGWAIHELVAFG